MITDQGKVSSDAVGKSYDRAMTGTWSKVMMRHKVWAIQVIML
jgi:hypothetical protein